MVKEDFKRELRSKLVEQIPVETRRKWTEDDLYSSWWLKAKNADSYLTWERAPADLWQHVKEMCSDLIGKDAI